MDETDRRARRKELLRELWRLLRPHEREVVRLRLRGLSDGQIGIKLGINRAAVGMRMTRMRRRIAREMPEARHLLSGGSRRYRKRVKAGRAV